MNEEKAPTSIRVFRRFLHENPNTGQINAEEITSLACYDQWLKTRKAVPKNPEKAFQRALSSHVCGVDGRLPFTQPEEMAILRVIRRKEKWPCYVDKQFRCGLNGFRAKGFHERHTTEEEPPPSRKQPPAAAAAAAAILPANDSPLFVMTPLTSHPKCLRLEELETREILPTASAFAHKFQEMACQLLEKFELMGADAWESILGLTKYCALGAGINTDIIYDQGHIARVKQTFDEYCLKHPNEHILVLDLFAKSLSERILFQSSSSIPVLGHVAVNGQGATCKRKLFDSRDNWRALLVGLKAWMSAGTEMEFIYRVHYLNGRTAWSQTWVLHDERERVFFLRGYVPINDDNS